MKNCYTIFVGFFLSVIMSGCGQEEIIFDIPATKPKIVMNALFKDQSCIYIRLTQSRNFYERDTTPFKFLENATIKITSPDWAWERDTIFYNTSTITNYYQYCILTLPPKLEITYNINVSYPGLDPISATARIPEIVPILDSYLSDYESINDEGEKLNEIKIKFQDPATAANYYKFEGVFNNGSRIDFYSTDPVIDKFEEYNYSDDLLPNLEDESNFINDELFNGETYELKILIKEKDIKEDTVITVELATVSKEYYLYHTTRIRQKIASDDPFSEPVQVYNNIEGGYGIFAGYNAAVVDTVRME